jgi:NitT/TauT family transport system permease protein
VAKIKPKEFLIAFAILLAAWFLLSVIVDRSILPGPILVFQTFFHELIKGEIIVHFFYSLMRVFAGTVLAVLLATPIGLILGQFPSINRVVSPIIYILYPIPKVVFIPIIFLFTGIGEVSKILIILIILFFQVLVLVKDQASDIKRELILSVRSLGAGRKALLWFVYLPACLPPIFTALRQSIGTAVAVLYLSELFATTYGLGYFIYLQGSTLMNFPAMYAGIIAMSILGISLTSIINLLEAYYCPWKKQN